MNVIIDKIDLEIINKEVSSKGNSRTATITIGAVYNFGLNKFKKFCKRHG